jgi:ABC-type transport system substrate-binding protein
MFLRDVFGAPAYVAKKARHITGVQAHGNRLTIRLAERAPDLPARLAITQFCALPTDTPNRPLSGAFPSAGPYYVAQGTPRRSYVLLRNPNYHGDRPHRLRRIEIVGGAPHPLAQIKASKLDYAIGAGFPAKESARLERLYGEHSAAAALGRQRYFVNPTLTVDYLDLNTTRPLFASARMRRAASYAIDRRALAANGGSFSTVAAPAEMNIPPGTPGFRDHHVYLLVPDLVKALRLAGTGHHSAELYCVLEAGSPPRAAQIIKNDLAAIGIDVDVHCVPGDEMWTLLSRRPWDIAIDEYGASYNDPGQFINGLATNDAFNVGHYDDPGLNQRIRAASRLSGIARAHAYARIDLALTRDIVPRINFANPIQQDFFSSRIGCQLYQPVVGMDLAALCIRPGGSQHG